MIIGSPLRIAGRPALNTEVVRVPDLENGYLESQPGHSESGVDLVVSPISVRWSSFSRTACGESATMLILRLSAGKSCLTVLLAMLSRFSFALRVRIHWELTAFRREPAFSFHSAYSPARRGGGTMGSFGTSSPTLRTSRSSTRTEGAITVVSAA